MQWETSGALIEMLGYAGALLTLAAYSMRQMLVLRLVGLSANVMFVLYGFYAEVYPQLLLHGLLLPLNSWRLFELRRLRSRSQQLEERDLIFDRLLPAMKVQPVHAGQTLFARGDEANELFYVVSGELRLDEIEVSIGPGEMFGELGLLQPEGRRTMGVTCAQSGELMVVPYQAVREILAHDPAVSGSMMKIASRRLLNDIERLKAKTSKFPWSRVDLALPK